MSESEHAAARRGFSLEIFDERFNPIRTETQDPFVTGRQIAALGHRQPPDEYTILMRSPEGGVRELAEDESVDLRKVTTFWAIESDRTYRLDIDGLSYEWPRSPVLAEYVYRLAGADPATVALVLIDPDGANKHLEAGDEVDLEGRGVEHFNLRPRVRAKTIFVDDRPITVDEEHLSGAQIKMRAGVEANYQLFLEQPGDDLAITDDHTVKIVDGARFYALPPATFG